MRVGLTIPHAGGLMARWDRQSSRETCTNPKDKHDKRDLHGRYDPRLLRETASGVLICFGVVHVRSRCERTRDTDWNSCPLAGNV